VHIHLLKAAAMASMEARKLAKSSKKCQKA